MIIIIDRIETNEKNQRIAVFETDNGDLEINETDMSPELRDNISEGLMIDAEIKDGRIVSFRILYEETEKKKNEMQKRLNSLFNRGKQK